MSFSWSTSSAVSLATIDRARRLREGISTQSHMPSPRASLRARRSPRPLLPVISTAAVVWCRARKPATEHLNVERSQKDAPAANQQGQGDLGHGSNAWHVSGREGSCSMAGSCHSGLIIRRRISLMQTPSCIKRRWRRQAERFPSHRRRLGDPVLRGSGPRLWRAAIPLRSPRRRPARQVRTVGRGSVRRRFSLRSRRADGAPALR